MAMPAPSKVLISVMEKIEVRPSGPGRTDKKARVRSGYLPSLDGWRALAVLGVMTVHDYAYPIPYALQGLGGYGLHLFFAISGVLICSRILEEESRLGRFDIKGFYLRRLLRIQPAAFVYLAVAALAPMVGISHEGWRYWFGALFFYRNYLPHDVLPMSYFANGHFWTLSVEEHFYVILSLFLFLVRRNRLRWMTLLVLGTFIWPAIEEHFHVLNNDLSDHMTQDTLRYLLWPSLLALILIVPEYKVFAIRYLHPCVITCAAMLSIFWDHYGSAVVHPWSHLWYSTHHPILGSDINIVILLFPFWVIATMLHPRGPLTRILEWGPLRWIGRLSYSLYLWHVVFFVVRFGPTPQTKNPMVHLWLRAPWNYLAAFACAALSYHLIEKPFIRLGHRLAPPATAGREDRAVDEMLSATGVHS